MRKRVKEDSESRRLDNIQNARHAINARVTDRKLLDPWQRSHSATNSDAEDLNMLDSQFQNLRSIPHSQVPLRLHKAPFLQQVEAPLARNHHSNRSYPSKLSQEISSSGFSVSKPTFKTRDEFRIAIFCALSLEANPVHALFDEVYNDGDDIHLKQYGDKNAYTVGRIGSHNIVLCHLPRMGGLSAASALAHLHTSYTQIQLVLVVGICGATPFLSSGGEVVLGDLIVSDSVVKYDFGRQYAEKFERKKGKEETLGPPDPEIQALLEKLRTKMSKDGFEKETANILQVLQKGKDDEYRYPGSKHDILCSKCGTRSETVLGTRREVYGTLGCGGEKVRRRRLTKSNILPSLHIGRFASADTVMKSGKHRDELVKEEGVIGFEMEGAGVWGRAPCIVIKGVCDYADSHKNKLWQDYAAATAAAGAAAFINYWVRNTGKS
ncbi:hypothetical protein TWF694_004671 [Orbilia ellipsospora]|uniref:Nucleoside phosphorylase domain-containing protein n=1 Tax=Orbilia ellipsospora TaxID=2528407 RepID=A0AAV9WVT3_9PEZI